MVLGACYGHLGVQQRQATAVAAQRVHLGQQQDRTKQGLLATEA